MKHKHADLIHAWADGAVIQMKLENKWYDIDQNFVWSKDLEYRIKPEEKKPVVRWLWTYVVSGGAVVTSNMYSEKEIGQIHPDREFYKLEWSRTEFPE